MRVEQILISKELKMGHSVRVYEYCGGFEK